MPTRKAIREIHEVDYHRNGISGIGFHVVRFTATEGNRMVGIVFPEEGAVAVLDVDETAKDNVAFAQGNSWRGDCFEGELRDAIAADEAAHD